MSKLDLTILVMASVAVVVMVAVVVAFYTGVYSPIKYDMSDRASFSRNGLRVADNGLERVYSAGDVVGGYQLQPTIVDFELEAGVNPYTEANASGLSYCGDVLLLDSTGRCCYDGLNYLN